jgi:hypothetical protein
MTRMAAIGACGYLIRSVRNHEIVGASLWLMSGAIIGWAVASVDQPQPGVSVPHSCNWLHIRTIIPA